MAVPKRKKCKSKDCIRLNFLKYKKNIMINYAKILYISKIKNVNTIFKKQKFYLI